MIVEDNGAWYIVPCAFVDNIIGPFENEEDAQNYQQAEQTDNRVEE